MQCGAHRFPIDDPQIGHKIFGIVVVVLLLLLVLLSYIVETGRRRDRRLMGTTSMNTRAKGIPIVVFVVPFVAVVRDVVVIPSPSTLEDDAMRHSYR